MYFSFRMNSFRCPCDVFRLSSLLSCWLTIQFVLFICPLLWKRKRGVLKLEIFLLCGRRILKINYSKKTRSKEVSQFFYKNAAIYSGPLRYTFNLDIKSVFTKVPITGTVSLNSSIIIYRQWNPTFCLFGGKNFKPPIYFLFHGAAAIESSLSASIAHKIYLSASMLNLFSPDTLPIIRQLLSNDN